MIFTVQDKDNGDFLPVYSVRNDNKGYSQFLIYQNNQWLWVSAKNFKPHESCSDDSSQRLRVEDMCKVHKTAPKGLKWYPSVTEYDLLDAVQVSLCNRNRHRPSDKLPRATGLVEEAIKLLEEQKTENK